VVNRLEIEEFAATLPRTLASLRGDGSGGRLSRAPGGQR
jgi:hypothetical protein